MAARTASAAALDATVVTLKSQLLTYIALEQTASPGDNPCKLFWTWLVGQLRNVDPIMAQTIDTANPIDPTAWDKTLSAIDPFT